MYALQRRLLGRDGASWRTVVLVDRKHCLAAMGAAVNLGRLAANQVEFRVIRDEPGSAPEARWTREKGWTQEVVR